MSYERVLDWSRRLEKYHKSLHPDRKSDCECCKLILEMEISAEDHQEFG